MSNVRQRSPYSHARRWLRTQAYRLLTDLVGDNDGRVLLPVLQGPAKGLRFRLDLVTKEESGYFLGHYDLRILRQVVQICRQGWCVWDCGGYLGFYTAFFARCVGSGGCVVVFEADPRNMARIKGNMALNGFDHIRFVDAAIGSPCGETDFILSDNTNSHIPGTYVGVTPEDYSRIEGVARIVRVSCLSLDQACFERRLPTPQLIKIDIDGAEKMALPHAEQLAREVKPLIVLELHNPECDAAAWEFAQRVGYTLRSLDTGEPVRNRGEVRGTLLCAPADQPQPLVSPA
ncbi:MAG TPA: FkbM family methyltransferase [Verrucomicrobiae bacterium]|nr:FkbM family methyltransferase [Verrucomicrobiae bacterium]